MSTSELIYYTEVVIVIALSSVAYIKCWIQLASNTNGITANIYRNIDGSLIHVSRDDSW